MEAEQENISSETKTLSSAQERHRDAADRSRVLQVSPQTEQAAVPLRATRWGCQHIIDAAHFSALQRSSQGCM